MLQEILQMRFFKWDSASLSSEKDNLILRISLEESFGTLYGDVTLQISSEISFEKAFGDALLRGINDESMVYLLWWKDTKMTLVNQD